MTELKTLKDLRKKFNVLAIDKEHIKIGNKIHTGGYFDIAYTRELKQEAIKWIKEFNKVKDIRRCTIGDSKAHTGMDLGELLKYIFNIDDEDLK